MQNNTPVHRPEKTKVREMFNDIAPRYDFLNTMLSLGIHKRWKKKVIRLFKNDHVTTFLDVATGTGDLAILAARLNPDQINGIDISAEMLAFGREKVKKCGLEHLIKLSIADSEVLPFVDNSFDAVTVGFGVRNFENLEKGLAEMLRVLKPGAKTVILEFSTPTKSPFRQLYNFYFSHILPAIGRIISRNPKAYRYLPDSVSLFPAGRKFTSIMESVGYKDTVCKSLSLGIASIYIGIK
jgi:demethylmenaquinone methyltransferase / 2-methoxy-6-polyprenyl-1,4-benzoquinol methylase